MTLPLLAAGISAVGSIIGGVGRRNQARARAAALKDQARNARQEAAVNAQLRLEESDRVGARAATLAAASGGGGLQGSALDVLADLSRQGMYRARQTVRDGVAQGIALMNDAETMKRQGDLDLTVGFFDAATTVLGQMGQSAQKRRMGGG